MKTILRRIRDRLLEWRYSQKKRLSIRHGGEQLRFDTSSMIAKDWFFPRYGSGRRLHEPRVCRILRAYLAPGDVFFDVGANLGFFTVLGARLCDPGGSVHAFELDPRLMGEIHRSVHLNRNLTEVHTVCCACTDQDGDIVEFGPAEPGNPSTNRLRRNVAVEGENEAVYGVAVTLTLDRYCRRTGLVPDLVKMDVEGAETSALAGFRGVLSHGRTRLVLELHRSVLRERGEDPEALIEGVRELDYDVRVVPAYREQLVERPLRGTLQPLGKECLQESGPLMLLFEPT